MPSLRDSRQIGAIRSTDFILIFTYISGQISYSYSMKWYSYSYSIVHPIEYEYCPSGGVRVRKTQGNWNVMCKDLGKDEGIGSGHVEIAMFHFWVERRGFRAVDLAV